MERERSGVVKIKGIQPPTFWILWIDIAKGGIVKTSGAFSESKLRAELEKAGCSQTEIDSLIQNAPEV